MKNSLRVLGLVILSTLLAPLAAQSEEVIVEEISDRREWMGVVLENHRVSKNTVRLAFTEEDSIGARLEVYAEKTISEEEYTHPTVQVTLSSPVPPLGGELTTSRRENFPMIADLSQPASESDQWRIVAPLSMNEEVLRALIRRNRATLDLTMQDGTSLNLRFSLSGSSHNIEAVFE